MDSQSLLAELSTLVGVQHVLRDDAQVDPYLHEQRGRFHGSALAVVRPADTAQVAAIVAACAAARVAITPQGGNTGLVGGGVPEGGVVLSLSRLNRVRQVDLINGTLTAEAGCILAHIQQQAAARDRLFPLSLAAEGSCQLGGNLATNAGGVNVLRYGNARDLVLGLEVVLADGRIWDGLRGLRKDNTGYDLTDVFIGSEGTLGIITAAVLKLFPQPRRRETAVCALPHAAAVLALFQALQAAAGEALSAFEFFVRTALEFTVRNIPNQRDPFAEPHPCYVLLELTSPRLGDDLRGLLEQVLATALEQGLVNDAVIAESGSQRDQFWALRETMPEAQKPEGASIKHDVSVPLSRMAEFLDGATALVEKAVPGVRVCAFGHVGDGNVHFNLSQPVGADGAAFFTRWDEINRLVHDYVGQLGGSFSAEHGIGRLKVDDLPRYKSAVELDLMRALKRAWDPNNLLNPGKVVRI